MCWLSPCDSTFLVPFSQAQVEWLLDSFTQTPALLLLQPFTVSLFPIFLFSYFHLSAWGWLLNTSWLRLLSALVCLCLLSPNKDEQLWTFTSLSETFCGVPVTLRLSVVSSSLRPFVKTRSEWRQGDRRKTRTCFGIMSAKQIRKKVFTFSVYTFF